MAAFLAGRHNVACGDLWAVAPVRLRHRVLHTSEGQAEDGSTDDVVAEVVEAVAEP